MTGDTALQLIALGATFILGMWSGRAWALAQQHVNGVLGSGLRAVDVNDAAEAAEDEPELPYRPAAEPYRFTYDTALRDLKPPRSHYEPGVGLVGPARDEEAIEALKSDPEAYFRRQR